MLYGKVGAKNFKVVADGISKFCSIVSVKQLGHRVAAAMRICCDTADGETYNIDSSIYLGDRLNAGSFASVSSLDESSDKVTISMLGRRVGLQSRESARSRRVTLRYDDYIGFTDRDNEDSTLIICDKDGKKVDIWVKLRLRDIYSLRLNNITERVDTCLMNVDDILLKKLDKKWMWTRKLLSLSALECLLRALDLWKDETVRNECRNEAAIRLMLGDLLFEGIDGLDEYNMYQRDAEQRIKDGELLLTCGQWLMDGGAEIAGGLRASDISEQAVAGWKKTLETDLGVILPSLGQKIVQRRSRVGKVLT